MVARGRALGTCRQRSSFGSGFRLRVLDASPDVGTHNAPLTRPRRLHVTCDSQRSTRPRRQPPGLQAVLWELAKYAVGALVVNHSDVYESANLWKNEDKLYQVKAKGKNEFRLAGTTFREDVFA